MPLNFLSTFLLQVHFGDNQEFRAETKEEQEVVAGCNRIAEATTDSKRDRALELSFPV